MFTRRCLMSDHSTGFLDVYIYLRRTTFHIFSVFHPGFTDLYSFFPNKNFEPRPAGEGESALLDFRYGFKVTADNDSKLSVASLECGMFYCYFCPTVLMFYCYVESVLLACGPLTALSHVLINTSVWESGAVGDVRVTGWRGWRRWFPPF